MQDTWPEFVYGNKTLEEYAQLVIDENRDVKQEIAAIVRKIQDIAKYPYETREETYVMINALCKGIFALLAIE